MTQVALLLADRSACLRLAVLRDLLQRDNDDPEVRELLALRDRDPLVRELLALQQADGSWSMSAETGRGDARASTAVALTRLGYWGLDREYAAVRRGAEWLYSQQQADGSWPLGRVNDTVDRNERYVMVPLQTALPLRGLAMCGYAQDPRSERAYDWLLAQRLEDGAWPTGLAGKGDVYGYVAGYRRLPHSRWGCRSNTTGALLALAHHPTRRRGEEAARAMDLLLGRETREREAMGFEVARMIGLEPVRGFFTRYARFDLAMVLDLCWRLGVSANDARVADLVAFVQDAQGSQGLWRNPVYPQASRWITLDLLRSLSRLQPEEAWLSTEPRTPFRAYGKRAWRW